MKLAVIIAFLFFGIDADIPSTDPCDNLKVTAEVKHTTDGLDNGSVEVKVEGGVGIYTIYLFAENRKMNRLDLKTKNITDLGKGEYVIIFQDERGCSKKVITLVK